MEIVVVEDGESQVKDIGYVDSENGLDLFEEGYLRTSWDDLLGNSGIFVGEHRKIRLEDSTGPGKAFLEIVIGAYETSKRTKNNMMEGHKYLHIYVWPISNCPEDAHNPSDSEVERLCEIIIYQGHDSDGSDYLSVIGKDFYLKNKC